MNRFLELTNDLSHYKKKTSNQKLSKGNSYSYGKDSDNVVQLPDVKVKIPSKARRESILKKAGWKKATLMITMKDFKGSPMLGRKVFVQSQAPDVVTQTDAKDVNGGGVIFSNFWIKPSGMLRILAISTLSPTKAPSGIIHYTLPRNKVLKLEATQGFREQEVTATGAIEAASKAGVKGSAGIDFKIVKLGGDASKENSNKQTSSISYKYKLIIPTDSLDIKVVR